MNNPTNKVAMTRSAKFRLKCAAAFTGRNGWAFRLHKTRAPATDIKPLQSSKRILLQHIWEGIWVGCSKQRLVVGQHVRWEWMELWHLYILGLTWSWLWLVWEERRLSIWNMVHSQIVCIWGGHYFSSSNLKPLYFLL